MKADLREQVQGVWELVAYLEAPDDGSDDEYPLGGAPRGLMLFTGDGFASIQIMREQPADDLPSAGWSNGSTPAIDPDKCIAYAGRYAVDDVKQHIELSVIVSTHPAAVPGAVLMFSTLIGGGLLRLIETNTRHSHGKDVTVVTTWKRLSRAE